MTRSHWMVHLVGGLTLWCLWFVLLYGGLGIMCSVASPPLAAGQWTWINGVLLILTLAFTVLLVTLARWCWYRQETEPSELQVYVRLSSALYGMSAFAVLAVGLPVGVLPPCA
ncbi:MAG: hypothetical protein JJU10_00525 [Idiomarina sp.]|nr:hypothetical protein [Idiomarina sp.]